jgi:hypothetical protein
MGLNRAPKGSRRKGRRSQRKEPEEASTPVGTDPGLLAGAEQPSAAPPTGDDAANARVVAQPEAGPGGASQASSNGPSLTSVEAAIGDVDWRARLTRFRPTSERSRIALAIGAIVVLWGTLVLPSITLDAWFYLDDPTTFAMGGQAPGSFWWLRAWESETGRYLPLFWLYRSIVVAFVGQSLPGFYGIQAGVILVTALLFFALAWRLTRRSSAGALAAGLFLTGSPIAENAYTTGKGEPLQLLFFGGLLLALLAFARASRLRSAAIALGGVALLQVACLWAKETGLVAWPLSVALAILIVLVRGPQPVAAPMRKAGALLAVSIASLVAAKTYQASISVSVGPGTYTGWAIKPALVLSNLRFYVVQQPDLVLMVGAIFLLLPAAWKRAREGDENERLSFAFATSALIAGCGFIAGMLAWRNSFGYYLYPASGLLAVAVALLVFATPRPASPGPRDARFLAAAIALAMSRLVSIPCEHYIATSQFAQARVYTAAVSEFARLAPPESRLFAERSEESSEFVYQTNMLIGGHLGRPDLRVHSRIASGATDPLTGRPLAPRSGDFLLSLQAYKPAVWSLRGVAPEAFDKPPAPFPEVDIWLLAAWVVKTPSLYISAESNRPRWGETWVGARLFRVERRSGSGTPRLGSEDR